MTPLVWSDLSAAERTIALARPEARRSPALIDGVRAIFSDGWGLIRASNTQPALVLRFEAASADRLTAIRAAVEGELAAVKRGMLS